jgi:hypothetical protein
LRGKGEVLGVEGGGCRSARLGCCGDGSLWL